MLTGGGVSSGHFRLDDHHDQFAISTEAELDANVRFRDSIQSCREISFHIFDLSLDP